MLKITTFLFVLCGILSFPAAAQAKLNVVSSYPYIDAILSEVAGNQVKRSTLASGAWDPHFIVAKPSLILKMRRADLLIINGAQQEIGWIPPLLRQSRNRKIQSGQPGLLDLSAFAVKIQVPSNVSRAMGDVHPQGNPHFVLGPNNVPLLSTAIVNKLCQLDADHCATYKSNNVSFQKKWSAKQKQWAKRMAPLKGKKFVQYHRSHDYFLAHYGLVYVNTLEPLPGIPPTPMHLGKVIEQVKQQKVAFNLRCVYQPEGPSKTVSSRAGVKLLTLPHDVGSMAGAKDIFSLYETLLKSFGV